MLVTCLLVSAPDFRPTLLVSGVSPERGNAREDELTYRLLQSLVSRARNRWEILVSWGEADGVAGVRRKLDQADAVAVMGGPDLSPSWYGGEKTYPNMTAHYPRSDESQIALVELAIARGVPLLGICRGMQTMNVALSGTLIPDLGDVQGHSNPDLMVDFKFSRHTVDIDVGSSLAAALGAPAKEKGASEPMRSVIHSAHHQAVERVGQHLTVTARAEDGTIEAIEHTSAPAVGVQWHPEDPDADSTPLTRMLERMHQLCRQPATV